MKDEIFQKLLETELSLQQAQGLLDGNQNNTNLLLDHITRLSGLPNFTQIISSSKSEDCLLSISDLEKMLNETKTTNLSDYCTHCHQCFYANDQDAALGTHKLNLEKCCLESLQSRPDEMEVSFWWLFIKNFQHCVTILPNYSKLMMNQGVPSNLRGLVWGLLALSSNSTNELIDESISKRLYESLNVDISEDIEIISNDVNRTFPQLSSLSSVTTKAKFERVLNAFSVYNFDVGYCQGLQFIVAPLLFHFQEDDEIKTFNSLTNLFDINPFLKKIYNDKMSNLNVFFYKFEKIFEKRYPKLFSHFKAMNLDFKIFLSQWFLSFYAVTMPFHFIIRMFDVLLFEGIEPTLLRVGLVILERNENLLMQIDDTELIYQHLLSENCYGVFGNNCDEFIGSILNLSIEDFTDENLNLLEMDFHNSQAASLSEKTSLPKVKSSFGRIFSGLSSKFPKSSSSSAISSFTSTIESDGDSILSSTSSDNMFAGKNNSDFSILTESTKNSRVISTSSSNSIKKASRFQLLKIDPTPTVQVLNINEENDTMADFKMVKQMYDLCLANGITDPVLDKVKARLGI